MEIEARWINEDPKAIETRLVALGATKSFDTIFQEWLFFHDEWRKDHRRVRVRADGIKTWLTYKANATWTIDSTEEVEVSTSSAQDTVELLEKIGLPMRRHQEKHRISYKLGNTHIDIDFWPKIPMVLEIEGPSEAEIKESARLLGLDWDKAIFEDQLVLHKKYYDIDLFEVTEYVFDK